MISADSQCVDECIPAINFGDRKGVQSPDILLLHYTGMDDGDSAVNWLCCEESGVSCHYLIHEDGRVIQMVPESKRAHHAGAGSWEGHTDVNSRSIGIEIVNPGHEGGLPEFPGVQMDAVLRLSLDIIRRNSINPQHVLGHSDIAPGRKIDPGERFDWQWLHENGVGRWVPDHEVVSGRFLQQGDEGQGVEALQSMLALYGYGVDINGKYDHQTHIVVEAFQRHFRQKIVDGVADQSTIETLHELLSKRPEVLAD